MKKIFLLFIFSVLYLTSNATHNRAGEITYRQLGNLFYEAKVVIYTKTSSNIDHPSLEFFWGDEPPGPPQGPPDTIPRINQTQVAADITCNTYLATHLYPAPATYIMHFADQNRNGSVINIPNSVNTAFYVQTQLVINPFLGPNNSPILLNPPIDQGFVGVTFVHNPGAYDPDGDSLSYSLFVCKYGVNADCPGYYFPIGTNSFSLDAVIGNLIWDTPRNIDIGEWNVAFLIEEWRSGIKIGYVERDMQIEIFPGIPNDPPILTAKDTCVEAGTFFQFNVTATDADGDNVTLTATGGPLILMPDSAVFHQPANGTGSVTQTFSWQTECHHVQRLPYQVLFKAQDDFPNPSGGGLLHHVVFYTSNILIVAPSPKNPVAIALGNSIILNWDKEVCDSAKGYLIYRRNGYYGFIPGPCETGVPAYTGYQRIAKVTDINTLTFIDNNNGAGLIPGNDYCYMITAFFKDSAESYASLEVCEQLKHDLPVITNVSIDSTDAGQGKVYVAWSKPTELDTIQTPGPYKYVISRSNDYSGSNFILVDSLFDLNDTIFNDQDLNTVATPLTYKVDFYNLTPGNEFKIGTTHFASSVYLTATPTDHAVILSWKELVPWTNTKYVVFRQNASGTFDSLSTVTIANFTDTLLINGQQYCYKIKSIGSYSASGFVDPIENFSQQSCATPFDNIPPCVPILSVKADCDNFRNILSWKFDDVNCPTDVMLFNIYYAPSATADPELLISVSASDTSFIHDSLFSIAGCYQVSATDSTGNESALSEKVCVDNCPKYELPNVFTPNTDGINDLFHPFPYSYVKSIDIIIFDRWGLEMFKTQDPNINWDGTLQNKGKECPEGVYYYLCTVYEIYLDGIKTRNLKGFVHLLRNK